MKILGSHFEAVMDALEPKLAGMAQCRRFDPSVPLARQLEGCDGLILGMHRVTEELMAGAPALKLLHQHGRGLDGVDLEAARRLGVTVANVPGGNSIAVAELAIALLLQLAKGLHCARGAVAERRLGVPVGIELSGKLLAVVGLGSAGVEIARRASCFGMRVEAVRGDPGRGSTVPLDALHGPAGLDGLLARADVVVLTATMTAATRNMIGEAQLRAMRPGALLVNVARAGLVDRAALFSALESGWIRAAASDVFWEEPADPGDPLLSLPNFVLTPHVAGFSDVSIDYVTSVIAENIGRHVRGEPLLNAV